MKVAIVEDEKLAVDRLKMLLKEYDTKVEIVCCLESIEEAINYLKRHPHPDLLLLDIHLSDGHCFEIFKQIHFNGPVIFTTAYDQYALDAFKIFSVDYILKPVTLEALAAAMNKLQSITASFTRADLRLLRPPAQNDNYKKRFLGKIGPRLFYIDVSDISYFQAENKIVFLINKEGNRFLVDHTMEGLELILDPREFFRLNRKFIVRINAIQQVKPYYNNRLRLDVKGCGQSDEMVISRDRVAAFKLWAET